MGQPGWKGCLRVAGLFMAGIFVGGLGAGIAEHDKYLVGSSPGTYALIMAHLGMKNQFKNLNLLEASCCKKRQKKSQSRYLFLLKVLNVTKLVLNEHE